MGLAVFANKNAHDAGGQLGAMTYIPSPGSGAHRETTGRAPAQPQAFQASSGASVAPVADEPLILPASNQIEGMCRELCRNAPREARWGPKGCGC